MNLNSKFKFKLTIRWFGKTRGKKKKLIFHVRAPDKHINKSLLEGYFFVNFKKLKQKIKNKNCCYNVAACILCLILGMQMGPLLS